MNATAAGGGTGGGGGGLQTGGGAQAGGAGGGSAGGAQRYGALVYTTPPRSAPQAVCSSELAVSLVDDAGAELTAPEDLTVFIGAIGLSTFSDPQCMSAATQLTLRSDAGFYFSGSATGTFSVTLTSASAEPVSQLATVTAGMNHLTFTTPPQAPLLAGGCMPLTIELRDATNTQVAAPAGGQRVDLTAAPGGLRFSLAASCGGMPPASVTVPAGMSSATFYVSSNSGRDYTVTASATGFASAMYVLPLRPLVHTGTCDLGVNEVVKACAITPPQLDPTRTFLVYQASSAEHDPGNGGVACVLGDAGSVSCQRLDGGGTASVTWQTAEVSGARVDRYEFRCPTDGGATTIVPLAAAVPPAQQLTLAAASAFGADLNGNDLFSITPSATQLAVTWGAGCNVRRGQLQVVQVPGFTTARAAGSLAGVLTGAGTGLPAAAGDPFTLATWRSPNSGTGENRVCDRMLRASATGATSVAVSRAVSNPAAQCIDGDLEWAVERVDTGMRASVQALDVTLAVGALTATRTLTAVDLTRTLVFASGQPGGGGQAGGEGSYDVDGGGWLGDVTATLKLPTSTQLQVTRTSARGAAAFTVYVVELNP